MSREDDGEPREEGEFFQRDAEPRQEGEFYSESESRPPREPPPAAPAGARPPPDGEMSSATADSPADLPSEARNLGMLCHLVALTTLLGIPGILSVLVIWLVKRDEHPFVDAQGKEALNFNITVIIAVAVCFITVVGILLIVVIGVIGVVAVVLPIVAGLKANDGISYRYPLTIRFLK